MNKADFNRDFWAIVQDSMFGRRPVSYDTLFLLFGSKMYLIFRKLEQNKNQKLILRPFHGVTLTIYRH